LYSIDSLLASHTASLAFPIPISSIFRRFGRSGGRPPNSEVGSIDAPPLPTFVLPRSHDAPPSYIHHTGSLLGYASHISNFNISRYRNPKFPPPLTPLNSVDSPIHPDPRYTSPNISTGPEHINRKSRAMDPNSFRRIYKLDS